MSGVRVSRYRYHPFLTVVAAVALILLGIGAAYLVWINMLRDQERLNPSTERVLVTNDGERIPLTQPSPTVAPTAEAAAGASDAQATPEAPVAPTPETILLPPERLIIPRISLNWLSRWQTSITCRSFVASDGCSALPSPARPATWS